MSENEIRALLRTIRADLDRALRRVVLPTALGAGIALAAGCSDDSGVPQPDSMTPDTALVDSAGPDQQSGDQAVADGTSPVDQQADQQAADSEPGWDFYPPPPYMAPDAAPLYRSLERKS